MYVVIIMTIKTNRSRFLYQIHMRRAHLWTKGGSREGGEGASAGGEFKCGGRILERTVKQSFQLTELLQPQDQFLLQVWILCPPACMARV